MTPGNDDLDLSLDRTPDPLPPDEGWSSTRTKAVVVAVVIACLSAIGWYWWSSRREAPAPVQQTQLGVGSRDADVAPLGGPTDGDAALPPLDGLDPFLRTMLGGLSARPELTTLLTSDDLIRRFVVSVDRIGRGATPSGQLQAIKPAQQFSVERQTSAGPINPASFSRYDGLAATIDDIDPAQVAEIYGRLRPRLEEAYAELGNPGESFDRAMERAISQLLAVPAEKSNGQVRPDKGLTFAWTDAATENMSSAQKHLLRMGPRNTQIVQRKLRAIADAIGMSASALPQQ